MVLDSDPESGMRHREKPPVQIMILMAEMCVSVDFIESGEVCSSGEVLLIAIIIECLFYLLVAIGFFSVIKRWFARREKVRLQRAQEWSPLNRRQH